MVRLNHPFTIILSFAYNLNKKRPLTFTGSGSPENYYCVRFYPILTFRKNKIFALFE